MPRRKQFGVGQRPRSARRSSIVQCLEARVFLSSTTDISNESDHDSIIALIDATLPDQGLLRASLAGAHILYFDPRVQSAGDVLVSAAHMASALHADVQSVMIFSHGSAGRFALGRDLITLDNIDAQAAEWREFGQYLTDDATIDLFACSTAASFEGQALIARLGEITSARVLASTDLTGPSGDWVLEAASDGLRVDIEPLDKTTLRSFSADLVVNINQSPTATPSPVTGTTTQLEVGLVDTLNNATITWSVTSKPAGSTVNFSVNGTISSEITTATFDRAGAYTISVLATNGVLSDSDSVSFTVNQTLTSIVVSPAAPSVNTSSTQQFTAAAYDQFGVAMTSQPTFTWAVTSGGGSINSTGLYTAPSSAGSATIRATSGAVNGSTTATITVDPTLPTVAVSAAALPTTVSGTSTALSVLGADDGGESNLIYTWSASTKPAGATPLFSANGTNSAKNSTATFDKAGSYVFNVTIFDGTSSVVSSVAVTVQQTLTSITTAPASVSVAHYTSQSFTATAYDQFSVAMASQPTITWSITSGSGSIDSAGVYTAPVAAGSATIQATSGGVSGSATVTIVAAAPTIAVAAAALPATVTGTSTALSVLGADDSGESNLTYTWSASTLPAGAVPLFSANGTNAAKSSTVTLDKAGSYVFDVTIFDGVSSVVSSVAVTVQQTLLSISIAPSSASLPHHTTQSFAATAFDQFGAAMASQPTFTWSVISGSGSINSTGLYTAPATAGSATVQASSGAVSDSVSITITNNSPTISTPAAALPTTVTSTSTALSVLGADDGGESHLTYTWSATTSPAGAAPLFSANATNVAKSTSVTFDTAGSYVFEVTIFDGVSSVVSSIAVTVQQTLSSLAISPGSAMLSVTNSQSFSATGYDQFGAVMASQPALTWAVTSGSGNINSGGLYTASTSAGTATIQVSNGAVTDSATVTIALNPPTVAVPAAAVSSTVSGTTSLLNVLGADNGGESNLTYTWTASTTPAGAAPLFSINSTNAAKNTTVTFDVAGNYVFDVEISDGVSSVVSSVALTVQQTVTNLTVAPTSATVPLNGSQSFSAAAYDQFGAVISSPGISWNVSYGSGLISAAGLYTASTIPGTETITATSNGVTESVNVTVINSAPTIAIAADADDVIVTGDSTNLSVLGSDDAGENHLTYIWSATTKPAGALPTYVQNGTNAEKNIPVTFDMAGSYVFTVTITDANGASVTSSVGIVVEQTLSSIVVAPSPATVFMGTTQAFSAIACDQFGIALAIQPGLTWTVPTGGGSIDPTGLYTAPASADTVVVTASTGGVQGAANITVVDTATIAVSINPSGTSADFSVIGVLGTGLTYTWSTLSKPAGATNVAFSDNNSTTADVVTGSFTKLGSYTIRLRISDGVSATNLTTNVILNPVLTSMTVAPATASLALNGTATFSATGTDQFGGALAISPTWAMLAGVGTIDSGGHYIAPGAPGNATIRASSGAISAQATITIINTPPFIASTATASSPTLNTVTLSVLGADDNGEGNLIYTWSLADAPPADVLFSANASHSARSITATFTAAGDYHFLVTISDGQLTVTDSVTVHVAQVLTSIEIAAVSTTVYANGSRALSVTAYDQFGDPMSALSTLNWSIVGGPGSINSAGLFLAGPSDASTTVRASSGGVQDEITLNTIVPDFIERQVLTTVEQITPNSSTAVLRGDLQGADPASVIYTWELIGFAPPLAEQAALFSTLPPVELSLNGSNDAKLTTATFTLPGTYTFRVTAYGGVYTGTQLIDVVVRASNESAETRMVSRVQPVVDNDKIHGMVITFNGALDAATAEDVRAYRLVRTHEQIEDRSWVEHLFQSGRKSRTYTTRAQIVSAEYDDQTYQVTLTLARPLRMMPARWMLKVLSDGDHAVRDSSGQPIDASWPDGTSRSARFYFKTATAQRLFFTTATGRHVNLNLQGDGSLVMVLPLRSRTPSVWLCDTNSATRLSIHARRVNESDPAIIAQLCGPDVEMDIADDVQIVLRLA